MKPLKFIVSPDCYIEVHNPQLVRIGDDRHMNGMDSPASIYTMREARALIDTLHSLIERGTWQE